MKPELILGGPGTGKTYQLTERVKRLNSKNFAFLAFTKRAANEAKQRLSKHFSKNDLENTRTIHSLCFNLLDLRRQQVVNDKHLKAFGEQKGYSFKTTTNPTQIADDNDDWYHMTEDDVEYRKLQIAEAKMETPDVFDVSMLRSYMQFKTENNLVDYNDMLKMALADDVRFPVLDLLCVDELQDLTPLQMQVIYKLIHGAKHTVFAGDGNQMIFEWAGVDRKEYLSLVDQCDVDVLVKNYRLPTGINGKAHNILTDSHTFREDDGSVYHISPTFQLNEPYLVLARHRHILSRRKAELEDYGMPEWCWLYEKDENKNKHIKVYKSTIHGAKGAEVNNVVILPDVSPAVDDNLYSEAERRVWYVGLTRAKKRLVIMEPMTDLFYDLT